LPSLALPAARIVQTAIMALTLALPPSLPPLALPCLASPCLALPCPLPAARIVQTTIMALIISSLFATIDAVPEEGRNAVAVCVLSAIFLS